MIANLSAAVAVCLVGAFLSGCGNGSSEDAAQSEHPADAERGLVGTVEGTDAFVALVAGGGEAVVYVCDGNENIAEWFAGPVEGTSVDLSNEAGARIEATVSDGEYSGTVTLAGGERHRFQAVPAEPGAGLLRVTGPEAQADGVVAGWIVNNNGEHRGSLRVGGIARSAPPAPDESLTVDGTRYRVSIFMTLPQNPATPPGVPIPYPNIGAVATG